MANGRLLDLCATHPSLLPCALACITDLAPGAARDHVEAGATVDLPPPVLALVRAAVTFVAAGGHNLGTDDQGRDSVEGQAEQRKKKEKKEKKEKKKTKKKSKRGGEDSDDAEGEGACRPRKQRRGEDGAGAPGGAVDGEGGAAAGGEGQVPTLLVASELLRMRAVWDRAAPPQLSWPSAGEDLASVTPESVLGTLACVA